MYGVRRMHKSRIAWAASGLMLVLAVVGLCIIGGRLTHGGAVLGGTAVAVGTILPFFTSAAEATPAQVAKKPLRKTEILGLLIFVLMAAVMLAFGAALFFDWLAEPESAPSGTPVEIGPVPGDLIGAGSIPVMGLVIGVEVVGGLSLIALYMLSGLRGGA